MDRGQIIDALTALGCALDERGVTGEMYVVGVPPSRWPTTPAARRATSTRSSSQSC
jgi:hypothetical protein